jgi:hypothetical protein
MTTRSLLLITIAAVFLCAAPALAQQPAPEGQREDDTPSFTNDDIAPPPVEGQPAGAQTEGVPEDPSLTPEERAEMEAGGEDPKAAGGAKGAPRKKENPAELAWRRQYASAESAWRGAEARAQQAELATNDLRNRLARAGSSGERNDLAAELDRQGEGARQARQEAATAKAAFERVKAEGQARKYTLAPGPSPTQNGRPNPQFHQQRVARARADVEDATSRVEIYQARVNDARGRILNNSGSGDNYAQARLQTELDEALKGLEQAQTDVQTARSRYDAALDAAVRAGVPVPR